MASFQAKISRKVGKDRERKKINLVVPFRSYSMRNRKFQKNNKKNSKKIKTTIVAPFQATIG